MRDLVLVVSDDILFWAQIHAAAAARGQAVERISSEDGMEKAWSEGGARRILADLGARSVNVLAWARRLKAGAEAPEIVGFVSHVDLEARARALEAGFDEVLTNAQFARRIEELL